MSQYGTVMFFSISQFDVQPFAAHVIHEVVKRCSFVGIGGIWKSVLQLSRTWLPYSFIEIDKSMSWDFSIRRFPKISRCFQVKNLEALWRLWKVTTVTWPSFSHKSTRGCDEPPKLARDEDCLAFEAKCLQAQLQASFHWAIHPEICIRWC